MIRIRIPGEARQVLDFIIRKTYGFNKKADAISLSQFVGATGIKKPNVIRAIIKLDNMCIIKKDNNGITKYMLNKNFDEWKALSKRIKGGIVKDNGGVSKKITGGIKKDNKALSKKIHTIDNIDNITINNITKDNYELNSSLAKNSDHHKIIKYWTDQYMIKFGVKYDFQRGKDGSIIKRLLKIFKYDGLKLIIDTMLSSNDDFYKKKGGYTIGVLSANSNKLAQQSIPDNDILNKFSPNAQQTIINIRNILERDKQNETNGKD